MSQPRFSNVEFLTPTASPLASYMPSYGGKVQLSSQDRILIENGGSGYRALDIYLSLFVNPVVYSSWDKVLSEICSRELLVEPAPDGGKEAERTANFVRAQLNSLGMSQSDKTSLTATSGIDGLTRALGVAYVTGLAAVELVWGRDTAGKRIVQYAKPRDPRLFRIEYDTETRQSSVRVLTRHETMRGVAVPERKFILHRHWAVPNDDEYGSGLGRNLYYPVEWQKQLMSYWLMLVDKTIMPSTIGSYEADAKATPDDLLKFEEAVRRFGQDSALLLPPGFSINTQSIQVNNVDLLEKLLDRVDTYIETLIVGESATGKAGTGSEAKDRVSNGIRLMNAKALSDAISMTLNQTLVRWLVQANFGKTAPVPSVWRNWGEDIKPPASDLAEVESIAEFVDLMARLDSVGIVLDRDYVQGRLNAPLRKPTNRAGQPAGPVPSPAELLGQVQ